jgi:hypothetical protein
MLYRIAFVFVCACSVSSRGDAPRSDAAHPFASHALRSQERRWLSGEVQERVAAGPYVYLRLRQPSGQLDWLVSLRATTPADASVRAFVVGRAEKFHSPRLGRDFSPLLFAAVRGAAVSENPLTLENAR